MPGRIIVGASFDASRLTASCIERSGIPLPPGVQRAVGKRQAEYLAGRICARKAIELLTGSAMVPPANPDRSPRWPESVCGSITHSDRRAMVMVASRAHFLGLGIDLEAYLDEEQARELAGEILTETEHARFVTLPAACRAWLLTLTFSLKESLYKALYPLTGRHFYFEDAELLDWSAGGHARLRLLRDLSVDFPHGTEVAAGFQEFDGQMLSHVSIANPMAVQP